MKFAQATLLPLLLLLGSIVSLSQTQSVPVAAEAVQVTGLAGIKENTKGTMTVENGSFTFATSKSTCDVSAASIQDVVTGNDSQRVIGGTVGTLYYARALRSWAGNQSLTREDRHHYDSISGFKRRPSRGHLYHAGWQGRIDQRVAARAGCSYQHSAETRLDSGPDAAI